MRPSARTTALSVLLALSTTGTASPAFAAGGCVGRPGASALEQYCEAVPNADGSRDKPGAPGTSASSSGGGVSSKTQAALDHSGKDGAAVAALAGASGGGGNGNKPGGSGSASGGNSSGSSTSSGNGASGAAAIGGVAAAGAVAPPKDPSGNPLKAAQSAAESGPTASSGVLWAVVGMSALGGLGAVLIRRRGFSLEKPEDDDQ